MNKKLQKGIVAAVAATMGTGIVAPVYAASAETTDLASKYAKAYEATVNAKTQKELTAARTLVDALYAQVKGTADEYLATTLSSLLDPVQQKELVKLDAAIKAAEKSGKQADVNVAKALIVDMPEVWRNAFSSYMDGIQQPIINKAVEAAKKAQESGAQADYDAAKALYEELLTVTNNDGVKSWVETALKAELDKVVIALKVDAVSATNGTTLTVVGAGLKQLKAEDITISGITVTGVVASEDGKSATVTLESSIVPNEEVTVTVKGTAFKVTNGFVVTKVEVNETTFDDERAGQKITLKVNGTTVDSTVDYLNLAGYDVNFVATDADGNAAPIFVGGVNTSTDGKLVAGIAVGTYTIEVQLNRTGSALISDKGTIKVANLDATTTTINTVSFVNYGALAAWESAYDDGNAATTEIAGTDFVMNSTTLVSGEKARIHSLTATTNGVTSLVQPGTTKIETSNPGVVSVAETGAGTGIYELTAESAGTATITVTYEGNVKTFTFTVKNEKRTLTSMTLSSSSVKVVKGTSASVKFKTFDQYGDPIAVTDATGTDDITENVPVDASSNPLVTGLDIKTNSAGSLGSKWFSVVGNANGSGTVYFKDNFINPNTGVASGKTLASLSVQVVADSSVASRKFELYAATNQSADNALEMTNSRDNKVSYYYSQYNPSNLYLGDENLYTTKAAVIAAGSGYYVEAVNPAIVAVAISGGTKADITAVSAGTTDVVVKDINGNTVAKTTITVTNTKYKLTGITFKSVPKVTYAGKVLSVSDLLTVVESNGDDIIQGVTLNKATTAKVRIIEAADVVVGNDAYGVAFATDQLFLDMDNDGLATAGDIVLGSLAAFYASDASVNLQGKVNATGSDYITNGLVDATAAGNSEKGTVLIKVMTNPADPTTAIAGTSVSYDVK